MSRPDSLDAGHPENGGKKKERAVPIRWIVEGWRWVAWCACKIGLNQPHAPHWFIAFFTLLLAVFAYYAWDESTQTTKALQGQLKATREATEVANRGWLAVPFMLLTTPIESGKPVDFLIRLVNTGRSPALHGAFRFNEFTIPYILDRGGYDPDAEPRARNTACDGLVPSADSGLVIWPGNTNFGMQYSFEDTEQHRQFAADAATRKKSLVVEGCFAYTTAGAAHTSAFRFFLRDTAPSGGSFRQSNTPGPGCEPLLNGTNQCRWMFNSMLSGNDAN